MARNKRRTSSRVQTGHKRKIAVKDYEDGEYKRPVDSNWFFQQSPVSQVYYLKVSFGVITGAIIGLLYGIQTVANNWFIFPLIGIAAIGIATRKFLDIDKDTINDLKLYAWTGTISLIIAFIVTSTLISMFISPPSFVH